MNKVSIVVALTAVMAFAQEQRKEETTTDQFQYTQVSGEVINLVRDLVPRARIDQFQGLNTVVIKTSVAGDTEKVLALLKKYDVPKPVVKFTTYMVAAPSAGTLLGPGKPVPAELQSAIDQMKQTLGDRQYSLRDIIEVSSSSDAMMDGALPDDRGSTYSLSFDRISASRESRVVQIGRFYFSVKACPGDKCPPLEIQNSGMTIQEGRKVVLGKMPVNIFGGNVYARGGRSTETVDLYLVVTAKIEDVPK